jgi:hypothetical protein
MKRETQNVTFVKKDQRALSDDRTAAIKHGSRISDVMN